MPNPDFYAKIAVWIWIFDNLWILVRDVLSVSHLHPDGMVERNFNGSECKLVNRISLLCKSIQLNYKIKTTKIYRVISFTLQSFRQYKD